MKSFFARHEVDKKASGFKPGTDGYPSNGRIAWALWGGDPGQAWANKLVRQIDAEDKQANTNQEVSPRAAIRSHLGHLIGIEKKRILGFASNTKTFCNRCEAFYSKFDTTLSTAISKFAEDRGTTQRWIAQSKVILLQVCECQPEQLVARLEEEFATWESRIDALTDEVLKNA